MRILNQFTETFSETISEKIKSAAKKIDISVEINSIQNLKLKEKHIIILNLLVLKTWINPQLYERRGIDRNVIPSSRYKKI